MNKKRLFLLLFLFNVFLLGLSEAKACSCRSQTTCEAFARTEIIFTGRIVKAAQSQGIRTHRVQVEENFFGLDNTTLVDVLTDYASSCAFAMEEGKDYLIFAGKNKGTGAIGTGLCSHTRPLEDAAEDLKYLRSMKNSNNTGGTVEGLVYDAENSDSEPKKPAEIDRVFIENKNGEKYEAEIKADGKYRLNGLIAGIYKVYLDLPKGFITDSESNPYDDAEAIAEGKFVEVPGRGCAVKNFNVKIDGTISGRVLDVNGLPVKEQNVNLLRLPDPYKVKNQRETSVQNPQPEENSEDPDEDQVTPETPEKVDSSESAEFEAKYDAYSDENGFYIFKGLPPGRYLLGVEIDDFLGVSKDEDQYLPVYFPGSKKRETAVIIELKRAETLADKNIQLFPKLKKRIITGQIIWKNGRVEPKARVEFYDRREGFSKANWGGRLTLDAKGNFKLEGFEETEYLIRAQFEKPVSADSAVITHSSKCFVLPKKGAVKPFKLILEPGGSNCDEEEFRGK